MDVYSTKEVLFKRNIFSKIIKWKISIVKELENKYFLKYEYGEINGNIQTSYSDEIIGKANRDNCEQALSELNSVWERHRKKGYKSLADLNLNPLDYLDNYNKLIDDINKALPLYNTDANNCVKPMKCQKFQIGKFHYPCLAQAKINGVRAVIMLEPYTSKDLFELAPVVIDNISYKTVIKTKEGLQYNIKHIENVFNALYNAFPKYKDIIFDGEIYIPNEKVTSIGGAARNDKNPLHEQLLFVNFDLSIPDLTNKERDNLRYEIWNQFMEFNVVPIKFDDHTNESYNWKGYNIIVLRSNICYADDQALSFMEESIKNGFEGLVIRDINATYQFGSRPMTMMKLKKFEDSEFECLSVHHVGNPDDKVGFNVTMTLRNDINDLIFDCTVMGNVDERLNYVNNPPIGKMVTVKFYERTKNGLPFHANIIGVRDYEN